MPDLFGVPIADIIHASISPGVLPATLTKRTSGSRTPGDLIGGTHPTTTAYACRGVVLDYREDEFGDSIQKGDRKVLLVANSIAGFAVPEPNDSITIEGATYRIAADGVKRDPAAASYECQCRR